MTRDYNNQRRDDVRPPSRNHSSRRAGNERFQQTPRSGRPRLNRETVDHAWESGAPPKHADYRTRTNNGQPPRNNWRNQQPSEHPSAQNGRKPFGNRQQSSPRFDRTPNGNQGNHGPRPRSFDTDRRSNDYRGHADGPNRNGVRPGFRDNPRPYEQRPQYRGYKRGSFQNDSGRDDRQPREFGRDDRAPRSFDRQPHKFGRDNRSLRHGERGSRPPYQSQERNTYNPRWQSRPSVQQHKSFRVQPKPNEEAPQNEQEQFAGDYERFDNVGIQPEERHVTRLPDGRVLKGPRPVQRRNAEFWTDIASETENLIQPVETALPGTEEEAAEQPAEVAQVETTPPPKTSTPVKPKAPRKPRTRTTGAVAREKKPGGKKQVSAKPRSTGPKPSQRGFKWPSQ